MKRQKIKYLNESQRNCLMVLRAPLDAPSRGYSARDIHKKLSDIMSYNQVYWTLLNLELENFARRFSGAWKPGDGLRVLAARTDLAFTRHDTDVLNLADSMRQI